MGTFVKSHLGIILVITLFLALGALRLNDLSFYTPDSCRYLVWGNSLAHGKGFVDDTQPVPERFVINAPFYAVLISPVEALFPLSIIAAKVWTLLLAALATGLFYHWLSGFHGRNVAVIGSVIFAFNPALLFLGTELLSDAPFIAALMLTMFLLARSEASVSPVNKYFIILVILSPCIVLLRETGVAMAGALVVFYCLERRWWNAAIILLVPMLVYLGWYLRNSYWAGAEGKVLQTNLTLISKHFVTPEQTPLALELMKRAWFSLQAYAADLCGRLLYPLVSSQLTGLFRVDASGLYSSVSGLVSGSEILIECLAVVLMTTGLLRDIRKQAFWLRLAFILLYCLVIFIYPVRDIRFLLPLLPFMVFYLVGGLRAGIGWGKKFFRVPAWAGIVATLILMFPNFLGIGQVLALNLRYCRTPAEVAKMPGLPMIYRYEWNRVGDWIRREVPESSVIATPVKDLVVVSGPRKVLEIDPGVSLPSFDLLLRDYQVGYIFASARWSDLRDYEFLMRESRRFWFEPVMAAPNLMKVHSRLLEPRVTVTPHANFDTVRASELLRLGRLGLISGDYSGAADILSRALIRAPQQPAVLYQLLVAEMMLADTSSVPRLYERLLSVPQSLSYAEMARAQWNAYRLVAASGGTPDIERKLTLRGQAARMYWDLGYYHRAAELLRDVISAHSRTFELAAAGLFYNLQNGDTAEARRFLTLLHSIDDTSRVVRDFDTLFTINRSVLSESSPSVKSPYHLKGAKLYAALGFVQEAVDEAERSLEENPANVGTLEFLARYYDTRTYPPQTLRYCRKILSLDPENRFARTKIDSLTRAE